jgi:hypothetical protein
MTAREPRQFQFEIFELSIVCFLYLEYSRQGGNLFRSSTILLDEG